MRRMRGAEHMRQEFCAPRSGFTLIEAIVVIAITGILASVVAIFIRDPVVAYIDTVRRAELSDAADTAIRHLSREVQRALPNSVRVSADGRFLELVPVRDSGRYRASPGTAISDDPLDFDKPDGRFDVLGPLVRWEKGDSLVVYNLGIPGADVYAGDVRRWLSNGSGSNTITFAADGKPFPFASPGSRFQIVSTPVSFGCSLASGELRRYSGYDFSSTQPTLFAAKGDLLVRQVSDCRFNYTPGALQRNGLVMVWLKLTQAGESISLHHQISVSNTP